MKVRITVSTVWDVAKKDATMAKDLLKSQAIGVAYTYLADACHGAEDMEPPTAKWEEA